MSDTSSANAHAHTQQITDSHGHHGHHHGHHGHDYVAANAEYFNENVQKFEDFPYAKELTERQAAAILDAYSFDEEKTELMDFACGIGLVSRELAGHTKKIVGVDISQGMVDEFNKRVDNQGISPEEMKAVCVQLKGEEGELDGQKFDVIICGMAYHHLPSIEDTTRILKFFLKPGGKLLVIDMLKSEDNDLSAFPSEKVWEHVVAHKGGFVEEDIRKAFEGAGLQYELNVIAKGKHHGFPTNLFLAKGTNVE